MVCYLIGSQQSRPFLHHPRHRLTGDDQQNIDEHQPSCASCARVPQQFSLPRKGQSHSGFSRDNYLTMPSRTISTRDDYHVEHDVHPPLRRGASYHHIQGIFKPNKTFVVYISNRNKFKNV